MKGETITNEIKSRAEKGDLGDNELRKLNQSSEDIKEFRKVVLDYKKNQNLSLSCSDSNQISNYKRENFEKSINYLKQKLNTTSKNEVYKEDQIVIKEIDDVIEKLDLLIKDIIETNQKSQDVDKLESF